eukprot:GSMAST32.ASY1.ANO1.1049.1 assembled CDS
MNPKERKKHEKWLRHLEKRQKKCCWYCRDKLNLHFIDMLTYPRPIRQFDLLVSESSNIGDIRALMASEVNIDVNTLILISKGKKLEDDSLTLADLRFRNKQTVILSKTMPTNAGGTPGLEEKNKQFVGDLLFGQAGVACDLGERYVFIIHFKCFFRRKFHT